jgi:hypothetical protein
MHELVGLGHSMTHAVVGLCRDETRTSEHIGISPAEEGWTVANDSEMYLVTALTCNVLQQGRVRAGRTVSATVSWGALLSWDDLGRKTNNQVRVQRRSRQETKVCACLQGGGGEEEGKTSVAGTGKPRVGARLARATYSAQVLTEFFDWPRVVCIRTVC